MNRAFRRSVILFAISFSQSFFLTLPAFASHGNDDTTTIGMTKITNRETASLIQLKGTLSCLKTENTCSPQIRDATTGEVYRLKTTTALLDILKSGKSLEVAIEGTSSGPNDSIQVTKIDML